MLLAARADATASRQAAQHPRDCGAPRVQHPGIHPRPNPDAPRRPPQAPPPAHHGQVFPLSGPRARLTSIPPRTTAKCRVLAPSSARPLSSAGLSGGGPRRSRHGRPAGVAGAYPGESGQPGRRSRSFPEAYRRTRARAGSRGPHTPPRHPEASWEASRLGTCRGMGDRFCEHPHPGGRSLDEGAGSRHGLPLEAHSPGRGRRGATSGAAGGRGKPGRSPAPFAILRGHRQHGGEHVAGGQTDRAARHREGGTIRAECACVSSIHRGDQNHARLVVTA